MIYLVHTKAALILIDIGCKQQAPYFEAVWFSVMTWE